ncbi:MAG: hypothetical protein F6K00_20475 [Leptolyngbya sp. SIOISBB]|nr:hypothetical protein [Leptolyngbya sp. SIOISBB]
MKLSSSYPPQLNDTNTNLLDKAKQSTSDRRPNSRDFIERDIRQFDGSEMVRQPAFSAEMQLLKELIEAGRMTAEQQVVVMHDQVTTGMTIAEILIARGWL